MKRYCQMCDTEIEKPTSALDSLCTACKAINNELLKQKHIRTFPNDPGTIVTMRAKQLGVSIHELDKRVLERGGHTMIGFELEMFKLRQLYEKYWEKTDFDTTETYHGYIPVIKLMKAAMEELLVLYYG